MTLTSLRRALVAMIGLAGAAGGIVAGLHYYDDHLGDWRIGMTAVAVGLAVLAGTAVFAAPFWLLLRPSRWAAELVRLNDLRRIALAAGREHPR
jgi:hypothetical protein